MERGSESRARVVGRCHVADGCPVAGAQIRSRAILQDKEEQDQP